MRAVDAMATGGGTLAGRIARGIAALGLVAALTAPGAASAADPTLLALGVGAYDFLHDQSAAQFRAELRPAQGLFFLKPVLGALITTDRSVYAYGGLRVDLSLGEHVVLMPVATVGYFDRGHGKDLGSHVEFKTGAELAWRFANASRLGVAFDHISNAGLTRRNPGTESILLVYSLPLAF
jgi:hypothetical protein